MLDTLDRVLSETCQLDRTQRVVVGVSGGPDSLCLLDALHRLGYALHVAHVNHQLRSEAWEDASFVQQAAERRGLPFSLLEVDVKAHADSAGLTVEAAGRELRYRFLFGLAQQQAAQAVAVGHTADDQVETVLMHLLRGSGLAGLRGMLARALPNAWSQEIALVRPLLTTWRQAVDAYCTSFGLSPRVDLSNQDPSYTRNRLRHELIPCLEGFQPGFGRRLLRMAGLLGSEEDLLESLVQAAWDASLAQQGERFVALKLEAVRAQPLAIQRRVLRRAVARLRHGLTDVSYEAIERAVQFLRQPPHSKQADWMGGLRLALDADYLWLAGWEADLPLEGWPQIPAGEPLALSLPGSVTLSDHWELRAEHVTLDGAGLLEALANHDPYQAWLDGGRLEQGLVLRGRQPGDQFQPLGLHGQAVSLKEWMINQKLPQRARAAWPLVCSGEAIVWIPGFLPAHSARLTPDTRQVIYLSLRMVPAAEY